MVLALATHSPGASPTPGRVIWGGGTLGLDPPDAGHRRNFVPHV